MAKQSRIPFEEFRTHVSEVFERVIHKRETVVVETAEADVVTLRAGEPDDEDLTSRRAKTAEDYAAFLRSGGSWADLDVDEFLDKI